MNECPSNNQQGIRCTLPLGHDGPHRNDSGNEPPMEWLNLGGGICGEHAPHSDAVCQRDKDHDGRHVDGAISWGF
jgi:hypothetical protein